jgi:photosystem II stability/assembly factor-like uncharacterized protein
MYFFINKQGENSMKNLLLIISMFIMCNSTFAQGWVQQDSGTESDLTSVHFLNVSSGWIVGHDGTHINTTNGGDTWSAQLFSLNVEWEDVFFIDTLTGWIVGNDNVILKTHDGGSVWVTTISSPEASFRSVFMINNNIGWCVGIFLNDSTGAISYSSNGGEYWFTESVGNVFDVLNDVFFVNEDIGWIVGSAAFSDEILLMTTDRGTTWIPKSTGTGATALFSVYFIDSNTGWVTGDNGIIAKTTDGGNSWAQQNSGVTPNLRDVYFISGSTGWVVGDSVGSPGGIILKTTDGGNSWNQQIVNILESFVSVYFVNENIGWVVGSGGTILNTTNGGVLFVDEEEITEIPTNYSLSQNYPNPFNPSTTIRYTLPKTAKVVLKIYNFLGQEVRTLVNEKQSAGEKSAVWDGRDRFGKEVSSGIYIYQMKAGDYVKSHKMILLR